MSKKSSGSISYNKLAGILALIALFIAGILGLINFIFSIFDGKLDLGRIGQVLQLISSICLLIAVVMISWEALYTSKLKHKMVWYVLYWIIVAFVILGYVGIVLNL